MLLDRRTRKSSSVLAGIVMISISFIGISYGYVPFLNYIFNYRGEGPLAPGFGDHIIIPFEIIILSILLITGLWKIIRPFTSLSSEYR